jgi:hypothetical protein
MTPPLTLAVTDAAAAAAAVDPEQPVVVEEVVGSVPRPSTLTTYVSPVATHVVNTPYQDGYIVHNVFHPTVDWEGRHICSYPCDIHCRHGIWVASMKQIPLLTLLAINFSPLV